MIEKIDILAFAAHPDDVELSAAGTLIVHSDKGYRTGIVDLTEGQLGTRGTAEMRSEESKAASEILGLTVRENLHMADGFFENNSENRMKLIEQIRRFKPEIVLANAVSDRHPDHGRASRLVAEAAFYAGLTKIESSWNGEKQVAWRPKALYHYIQDYHITPDFVVDVSPTYERKIEAIKAYKSQFYDPNSNEPNTPISGSDFFDFLKGRMMEFGRPLGVQYAEGFTRSRLFGVSDLHDLI